MICESRPTFRVDELARTETLADGGHVLIRPVLYSDRAELGLRFTQLSPESRRLRFFEAHATLEDRQLEYLTNLDYHDHFAWAAFDLDDPAHPGVGIARFIREKDPTAAEVAVTVLDAFQGRGLGTLLLLLLAKRAVDEGVRTFVSYVLWDNLTVLQPLGAVGARISAEEPGVARVELDLTDETERESVLHHVIRFATRLLHEVAAGAR